MFIVQNLPEIINNKELKQNKINFEIFNEKNIPNYIVDKIQN